MFLITKRFSFSASHLLLGFPEGHQCGRMHGHNYDVEVELRAAELDDHGFVLDYGDLGDLDRWLHDRFDHRHLNDRLEINPTAENIARYVFHHAAERWLQVSAVRVSETPRTWAEYRGPEPAPPLPSPPGAA